jgi:hypothetical protein
MDVSIIIVNYNTVHLIVDCINSIKEKTSGISYEIIVVDNHSDDYFQEVLEKNFGKTVKCLRLDNNVGFGRANNAGAKISTGRYIFCLNPDTLLVNNAIKILVDFLDQHNEVGSCGGNLIDFNNRPALSYRQVLPSVTWELCEMTQHKLDEVIFGKSWRFNFTGKPIAVKYITGADLMVRRSLFEDLGGYSDDFFMYYEDTDLCLRIGKRTKIYSVPDAVIQHLEGQSTAGKEKGPSKTGLRLSEEGRKVYYRRNLKGLNLSICDCLYKLSLQLLSFKYSLRHSGFNAYKYRLDLLNNESTI